MNDTLTGLNNKRHFLELAEKEFQRARRYKRPLAAMLLDVDGFKRFNDSYGRAVGDQVLRGVADRCQESLRETNLLARYGADEFMVLLLECDLAAAERVATRLHRRTAAAPINTDAGALSVDISTGCAELVDDVRQPAFAAGPGRRRPLSLQKSSPRARSGVRLSQHPRRQQPRNRRFSFPPHCARPAPTPVLVVDPQTLCLLLTTRHI